MAHFRRFYNFDLRVARLSFSYAEIFLLLIFSCMNFICSKGYYYNPTVLNFHLFNLIKFIHFLLKFSFRK